VAATVPVENAGDTNQLLREAMRIGQESDEEDADPAHPEPAVGSFERFMSTFANPNRWAGR